MGGRLPSVLHSELDWQFLSGGGAILLGGCPLTTGRSYHNVNFGLIMQEDDLVHVSDNDSVNGDEDLMKSPFAPNSASGREQPCHSGRSASSSGVGLIDRLKEIFPNLENSILTRAALASSSLDEAVE